VAFSPDGEHLVSVARGTHYPFQARVYVWELTAGRLLYARQISREGLEDTRVVVNQDASLVAVATPGASAEMFDLSSGNASRVLGEPQMSSVDVAFRVDGKELATAQRDGTVRLWNVATGAPAGVLRGHQAEVSCVRYSPDGKQIASAGRDFTVR